MVVYYIILIIIGTSYRSITALCYGYNLKTKEQKVSKTWNDNNNDALLYVHILVYILLIEIIVYVIHSTS